MKMKEKSVDINPVIVKVGLALALSFASFIYYRLINRRPKPSLPSSDCVNEMDSRPNGQRKDESETDKREMPILYGVASVSSERDEEVFRIPEFDDLVKEIDPNTDIDICSSDELENLKAHEHEIDKLHETVRVLREREMSLEVKLLEFYGLKEQESTVIELRNRLKLNTMEAKLFSLKIESLRAENRKLEAQLVDKAKLVEELEAARAEIRLLKKKLVFEAEENKEKILNLKRRVEKFEAEHNDSDALLKLKREIEELKKSNSMMEFENSELTRKFGLTQILTPEADKLRRENEDLKNEIGQLQADRCLEIEELVYLRWINACLRYELRDYRPSDGKGKTVTARDLSKSLSPRSEEKAKQLIMDYANTENSETNLVDFDCDQCSSSQASFTDSAEREDSSSAKTNTSSRKNLLNKLRRLLRGKDNDHGYKMERLEDVDSLRCSSSLSTGDYGTLSRLSLDLPRLKNSKEGQVFDHSVDGVSKAFVLGSNSTPNNQINNKNSEHSERSELLKYAEALKKSRRGSANLHRKSASYGL